MRTRRDLYLHDIPEEDWIDRPQTKGHKLEYNRRLSKLMFELGSAYSDYIITVDDEITDKLLESNKEYEAVRRKPIPNKYTHNNYNIPKNRYKQFNHRRR